MLQNKEQLLNAKNLLAFSAGVDSTALLFLLLENKITFDIAIVNYGVRLQSQDEVAYAQELAKKYDFQCHLLNTSKITKNFESNARTIRYNFFEELISTQEYTNLLTAHHLGDRFEWMLMQFCKGAGCAELSGMKPIDKRQGYSLIRPLLHLDKQELLEYLNANKIKYFEDQSNSDEKYKRNEFRHNYSQPLLNKYLSGIKKSFEYIDKDVGFLIEETEVQTINELAYFKASQNKRSNIFALDKYLKTKGHIITAKERELLENQSAVILGRKFIVSKMSSYILVAPYITTLAMNKKFKEKMRLLKIDPKIRGYLSTDSEAVELLSLLLV
ncbi:MAG: tRNA lysidine(34) synthetase TilS [Campylobacterota bacterium]|nr:tRNA lysidine(34) synthetase TilS [Campylobacterota bacterium]